jgi:CheY-like chemotaxis protein
MIKIHSGSAVPRYQIFVLGDGAYVVQWAEASVQDLMTGTFYDYKPRDFGHRITDNELDQLKTAGVIEDFDQAYIWVYALPEEKRFGSLHTMEQSSNSRSRSYYINTTLPGDKLGEVQRCVEDLGLSPNYCVCMHDGVVAVLGKDAIPFNSLKEAEQVQRKLQTQIPELLDNAALAFTENNNSGLAQAQHEDDEVIDLDALIASQTDTSVTQGKYAVVACTDEDERRSIMHLLSNMRMAVVGVATAQEALELLEEEPVDLLVMDVRFQDMHGWAMLGKAREITHARQTCVIVLADEDMDEQVFALTVAKVQVYLHKPISMARLRQSVWSVMKEHAAG